jgi:tRNA/tmRNA/rRNA uracil-C5-methylase (TrmA/RlmC/RlmD family)
LEQLETASAAGGTPFHQALLALQPTRQPTSALADVCCGTGTIGLVCAPYFARVVGVELAVDAVADARHNAELNNLSACATFVCSKAEAAMGDILTSAEKGSMGGASSEVRRLVAVVDPPRAGLNPAVIKALRTCRALKRIVYVSCNPTGSFIEDALKLCAPQEGARKSSWARGPYFTLKLARPVDLFPHTPHTEVVALFERT